MPRGHADVIMLLAAALSSLHVTAAHADEPASQKQAPPRSAFAAWLPRALNDPLPPHLSDTGLFADLHTLRPGPGLIAYDLNAPFWSDGAAKRRWITLPPGESIRFAADNPWKLPTGTILVKHFEWPITAARSRRIETRVLIVLPDGTVTGATYRWRDPPNDTDADLVATPATAPLDEARSGGASSWYYPGPSDCRTCHTPAAGGVLGVNTRQLNRRAPDDAGANQLLAWQRAGLLHADRPLDPAALPALVDPFSAAASLDHRARAYLDANCALCHHPSTAVAADFDARASTPLDRTNMLGIRPRIDLGLDAARIIAPADPSRSVLLSRIAHLDGNRMPPLAHERVDDAGVALLSAWIAALPGTPAVQPPTITPPPGDFSAPVTVTITAPDPATVVRYTLDGSVPRSTSPTYDHSIVLDRSTTIRARAFAPGVAIRDSVAVQATYIIAPSASSGSARP